MARQVPGPVSDRAWAILLARLVLGLIFGMAGWGKLFEMGATARAHRYFVDPYATTWIPVWLLWGLGLAIPYVEFAAGIQTKEPRPTRCTAGNETVTLEGLKSLLYAGEI